MLILHGIGGNSESGLARLLADACTEQGWRAVVYNRRWVGGWPGCGAAWGHRGVVGSQTQKELLHARLGAQRT